ncbi:MAG: glutamate dehydrogenase, partial [Massilia sp.]|nr:glutamate dehydrogenase [Massilia sp.]
MNYMPQDLRTQTLALVTNQPAAGATDQVRDLISAWLAALDEEDLAGTTPEALAPVLWDGFTQAARRTGPGCQIAKLRYLDAKGNKDTALLILNEDMPYLVDSFVMALRKERVTAAGVMNAVLPVQRDADGVVVAVGEGAPLESVVLVLMNDELTFEELDKLTARIRMVANDAAVVHRDAVAMGDRMTEVAAAAAADGTPAGQEVAAFLEWAKNEGFEPFGYAYYTVQPGQNELARDIPSRIGVLKDTSHPVYGTCLANIPGELNTLSSRAETLSIVKADVEGTLHRDQPLDFIGVRNTDAQGNILGEHCFVGLFTRAATSTPLARLPFARGRVAKVLSLAGVRQEGFRAEKFLEILESLPRTETVEADPEWLAKVCSSVVSLYKQPRAKVFARRDVYGRHMNALVYLPRERYSASVAASLAQAMKETTGAHDVRSFTLVADGPLARVYLIAHGARSTLDPQTDIQQPLLSVLDDWHDRFAALTNDMQDTTLRSSLRKLVSTLPVNYIGATEPSVAFRDLQVIMQNERTNRVSARIEAGDAGTASVRLYSDETVPPLSRILPALHNAGVAIDREQTYRITTADGDRHYVTALAVDAESAAKLAKPGIVNVAEELFAALFNDEAEDGRMNGLSIEGGLSMREVQLVRAYISYWRQL